MIKWFFPDSILVSWSAFFNEISIAFSLDGWLDEAGDNLDRGDRGDSLDFLFRLPEFMELWASRYFNTDLDDFIT